MLPLMLFNFFMVGFMIHYSTTVKWVRILSYCFAILNLWMLAVYLGA